MMGAGGDIRYSQLMISAPALTAARSGLVWSIPVETILSGMASYACCFPIPYETTGSVDETLG